MKEVLVHSNYQGTYEVSNNKEASIKLKVNGADFFVDKTGDSFEESVDLCIDVLKRKLEKHKEA